MEKTDIGYLKIEDTIKNKLFSNNLKTIEELSMNYLENVNFKEINFIQSEIFKQHIKELGLKETQEISGIEQNIQSIKRYYKDIYSISDNETYCKRKKRNTYCNNMNNSDGFNGNDKDLSSSSSYNLSSDKSCDISCDISSDISSEISSDISSEISSEISSGISSDMSSNMSSFSSSSSLMSSISHTHPRMSNSYDELTHENNTNIYTSIIYNNINDYVYDKDKNNKKTLRYIKKNSLEENFLIYSDFMKKNIQNKKYYKTTIESLNDLLCDGIETSQLYYFYGEKTKINKIILVNLLYDIILNNKYEEKTLSINKESIIFIHFSHINDISKILHIITNKLKKNKTETCHIKYDDILQHFCMLRIKNISDLISFLSYIKEHSLKNKWNVYCDNKNYNKEENYKQNNNCNNNVHIKVEHPNKDNTDKYNTDKYNTDKYNTDKYNTYKYNTDQYNNYIHDKNDRFKNISCIAIYNFTNLLKNININNPFDYFYLVRELKIVANMLNIAILIFDVSKHEIVDSIHNNKNNNKELKMKNITTQNDKEYNNNNNNYYYNNNNNKCESEGKNHNKICQNYINQSYQDINHETHSHIIDNKDIISTQKKKNIYMTNIKQNNINIENYSSDTTSNDTIIYEENSYNSSLSDLTDLNINNNISNNQYINHNSYTINNHSNHIINTIQQKNDYINFFYNENMSFRINKIPLPFQIYNNFNIVIQIDLIQKIKNKKFIRFTLIKSQKNIKYLYSYSCIKKNILIDM
ncbi:conserved Plasmodium protein, unknown function [Plasmodium sp. gorilla clade G2]|uniref:conserved Plasmodium protein, unknown function n=1 Tax=Plasmodium sp. gorilla clade G2 TaxID=880535 RepID=UPI000D226645|nr:conserved Plasmodium protein, unknown function [Plasmodium sp. gorilla clade G2]SOV10768.1 conserved Plasmodium protein, unknown function [Plasmodium sp. gorilla clade G2]